MLRRLAALPMHPPSTTVMHPSVRIVSLLVPTLLSVSALAAQVPGGRAAEVQVGMDFVDSFWADDANHVRVPGYALWNAGIGLRRPLRLPRGLTLGGSLRVENLLDEAYVAYAFLNPDVVEGEPVAFEPGLPRHAVLTVSIGWGR